MLSDENNIPVPAASATSTDDAPKDDHSPPSAFTITITTITMVTAMASLGFTIYAHVHNLNNEKQAKRQAEKEKDTWNGKLERMRERIDGDEDTVQHLRGLRR